MTEKEFWTPQQVYNYLVNQKLKNLPMILPDNIYCTENFSWNEVIRTKARKILLPSIEILNNLKYITEVLQVYRTKIGKEIQITSSWRTPEEQQNLITLYNKNYNAWLQNGKKGNPPNKPSSTSLHIEGLALDFQVKNSSQQAIQNLIDKSLVGEVEPGVDYTHLGLPTFSEKYLKRHGIFRDDIYKKLNIDTSKLTGKEREVLIKRLNPKNWQTIPNKFDKTLNAAFFKNPNTDKKEIDNENKEKIVLPAIELSLPEKSDTENGNDDRNNTTSTDNGTENFLKGDIELNVNNSNNNAENTIPNGGSATGFAADITLNPTEDNSAGGNSDETTNKISNGGNSYLNTPDATSAGDNFCQNTATEAYSTASDSDNAIANGLAETQNSPAAAGGNQFQSQSNQVFSEEKLDENLSLEEEERIKTLLRNGLHARDENGLSADEIAEYMDYDRKYGRKLAQMDQLRKLRNAAPLPPTNDVHERLNRIKHVRPLWSDPHFRESVEEVVCELWSAACIELGIEITDPYKNFRYKID